LPDGKYSEAAVDLVKQADEMAAAALAEQAEKAKKSVKADATI
jgi:hypothetical protein